MNDAHDNQDDFNEDKILISDLSSTNFSQHTHAQRVIILVLKSLGTRWMRLSLSGLLILALAGALFLQLYRPATPASNSGITTVPGSAEYARTIVAGDGQIFVQSSSNLLMAFQTSSGHILWQKQLPGIATLSADGQVLYCYYVERETVSATLEALRTTDGHILWQKTISTPLVASQGTQPGFIRAGDTIYTMLARGTIDALKASNGQLLWFFANSVTQYPLSALLYVYENVVEIKNPLSNTLFFLNANNGRPIVQTHAHIDGTPQPVDRSLIYSFPDADIQSIGRSIQVFQAPEGELLWSRTLPQGAGFIQEQDGTVYLSSITYSTLMALRGSDGYPLWSYHTSDGGAIVNNFLEQNGVVYLLQQDTTLVSLRVSDGHILWRKKLPTFARLINCCNVQLLLGQGIILVYDASPSDQTTPQHLQLAALNSQNGALLWSSQVPPGRLEAQAGVLYLLQNNGQVDALQASNGKQIWSYEAPAAASINARLSDIIILLDATGRLSALRINDGKPLWYYP